MSLENGSIVGDFEGGGGDLQLVTSSCSCAPRISSHHHRKGFLCHRERGEGVKDDGERRQWRFYCGGGPGNLRKDSPGANRVVGSEGDEVN